MRGEIPDIEPEQIHLAIKESGVLEQNTESSIAHGKEVFVKPKGVIKLRTPNQAQYLVNMVTHDISLVLVLQVQVRLTLPLQQQLMH